MFGNSPDAPERAAKVYADLAAFVQVVAPPPARLLDVGCGCGWSTANFARLGYEVTGVDLSADAFEPPPTPGLTLRQGSVLDLPFPDGSFDAVVAYQSLEHVPDPDRALGEMARVCRPGGVVAVLGPNLVSPIAGLLSVRRPHARKVTPFLFRGGVTARHPYGNTVAEAVALSFVRGWQLVRKFLSGRPRFLMREPDPNPPFYSDNDACYLCCPADISRWFQSRGWAVVQNGKPGRPVLLRHLAAGTWVAARKPGG